MIIRKLQKILLGFLFFIFSFQCFFGIQTKSPVTDTVAFHAVNGYVYLISRDFRMSPATPPLMREWVALPWLFLRLKTDFTVPAWQEADSVPFSVKFFYGDNRSKADLMLLCSRIMTWLISVLLFFLVRRWAGELYGDSGALTASVLYLGSPTIIGYSSVVNIDIAIAFFYALTAYYVWKVWGRSPGQGKSMWKLILSFAGALATKYTGVLLAPLILLFAVIRKGIFRGTITALMIGVLAMAAVWSTYFFELKPLLHNVPRIEEKEGYIRTISHAVFLKNKAAENAALSAARNLPIPLPTWILGFAGITRSHQDDYRHYFMGQWREVQVPYHYFASFASKATVPLLIFLLLRFLYMIYRLLTGGRKQEAVSLCLLIPPAVLFAMTWFDTTGVGIRYLIPVFPLFFIWVSGLVMIKGKAIKSILTVLLAAHFTAAAGAFPDYLAYFNPLVGGSENAYKYFRGNDLEWGQELKNLAIWLRKNNISGISSLLFGTRDESFYGIQSNTLTEAEMHKPEEKVYAVSVFFLDSVRWAKDADPIKIIGHTIWIYDFRHGNAPQKI